jgi:hypothetical protein
MTTIAIRDNIIAFDSRMTSADGLSPDVVKKAWRSKRHRVIWTGAGAWGEVNAAARHLDAMPILPWDKNHDPNLGNGIPHMTESILCCLHADGRVIYVEGTGWYETQSEFRALGTGSMAALAVMMLGHSAKKAVEIAIQLDHQSGHPITTMKIDPKLKTSK